MLLSRSSTYLGHYSNVLLQKTACSLKSLRYFSSVNELESPLSGVKIIDLTRIVAGPFCTMVLGDLGAEVFKIEQPGSGDEARKWGPPYVQGSNTTCYFVCLNRNKKSVCVNLKTAEGIKVIHDLAKVSDVLIENYVPGKLSSLGIGYEDLKEIAPRLIYLSLTGYGPRGPYSKRPGYDVIAASIGGLLDITGPEGGEPCKPGVAMTDLATGLFAHGAILAALLQRNKTGLGQKIDCNLLSTQVASLINIGSNYLNAGKEAKRWGTAHESIVPYETFATADGFLTVGGGSNQQFKSLCEKINMPHLFKDSRFVDNISRVKNREVLITELKKCFIKQTTADWLKVLEGSSFPYGQVNRVSQVFSDEHIQAIDLVKDVELSDGAQVKVVGPPVEYSGSKNAVRSPPPMLGEHTEQVLSQILNYPRDKIQFLQEQGHVQ
uniref:Succinate--hydroxymethylglutarate CoA-transferase n=1 Tax=Cuerna arida TaxID=1464854 RepID=A0A1B6FFJ9_9HEMI